MREFELLCTSLVYSKGLSHRNRLGGGSQSISKFSWEIEPTVSQFLNVHGKFSESRVSIGFGFYSSCALDKLVTSGAVLDPVCDDRSILDLVAIQVDTVRPYAFV